MLDWNIKQNDGMEIPRDVISPQRLYEQVRRFPLSCFYSPAWYRHHQMLCYSSLAKPDCQTKDKGLALQDYIHVVIVFVDRLESA